MKRIKKLTAAVLFTALSTGLVSGQDLSEVFESDNGRNEVRLEELSPVRYKLVYPIQSNEIVYVKIYDQHGQLLYSDRIRNSFGFSRPYDLKRLPDGAYKFWIWSSSGKIIRNMVLRRPATDLTVAVEETTKKDSYRLTVKGVTNEPVYVDIYDAESGLIFEEVLDVKEDFSRIYSFGIDVDNPMFVVTQQNLSISRKVR